MELGPLAAKLPGKRGADGAVWKVVVATSSYEVLPLQVPLGFRSTLQPWGTLSMKKVCPPQLLACSAPPSPAPAPGTGDSGPA